MKKASIFLFLFLSLIPLQSFTTAQNPEILLYKGRKQPLFNWPLETFFNAKNPKPKRFSRFCSTADWVGYTGTWEIKEGYLYLVKVVPTCGKKSMKLSKIFKGKKGPIKATWFNGTLRIPQGKQLQYVHMGFESVYERDLLITIKNGKVIGEEIRINKPNPCNEISTWTPDCEK